MKIAFHTNQIGLRGTEIALFDYAHFNESLLGNQSIIISHNNPISKKGGVGKNQQKAIDKFKSRFELIFYEDVKELDGLLSAHKIDFLYVIKKGIRDGVVSNQVRTGIHTVFQYHEPHGDIYAYVSEWLSNTMTGGKAPVVPHMINLPDINNDLREKLGIPQSATVFGQYGGGSSFNINFVKESIFEFSSQNPNCYFIFMNTKDFRSKFKKAKSIIKQAIGRTKVDKIIFLPGSTDTKYKTRFINTCDAMLHGRLRGETFGLAVGEFSMRNKPIITFGGNGDPEYESAHIKILGNKAFIYNNKTDLTKILNYIKTNRLSIQKTNWNAYEEHYSPEAVMRQFKSVFLSQP